MVRCGGEFLPVPFSLVVGGGIVAFCVPRQLTGECRGRLRRPWHFLQVIA
ncbi:hypothetical protein [Coleofasciculus sp.]